MSPSKIEVGKTYRNRGAGRTLRKVLEISDQLATPWYSSAPRPKDLVVRFVQTNNGKEETLYLKSFAAWCGEEMAE